MRFAISSRHKWDCHKPRSRLSKQCFISRQLEVLVTAGDRNLLLLLGYLYKQQHTSLYTILNCAHAAAILGWNNCVNIFFFQIPLMFIFFLEVRDTTFHKHNVYQNYYSLEASYISQTVWPPVHTFRPPSILSKIPWSTYRDYNFFNSSWIISFLFCWSHLLCGHLSVFCCKSVNFVPWHSLCFISPIYIYYIKP
jgi:hypothetical protein